MPKRKKTIKKEKDEEPLKIFGSLESVLAVSVKGNPKPKPKKRKK